LGWVESVFLLFREIMSVSKPESNESADRVLDAAGLRPTRQRKIVYDVIREESDHPTAELVHERARQRMSGISLATVYNCLESFTSRGLIRQLNFQRQSSRYCAVEEKNPHFAHFHCRDSGTVLDVELSDRVKELIESELPDGLQAEQFEVTIAGRATDPAKSLPQFSTYAKQKSL